MPVADMTLPDGSTRSIRGATRQDVIKKATRLSEELSAIPEVQQNPALTYSEFGARKFLNNLMHLPEATGEILALGAAGLQTVSQIPQDNDVGFMDRLNQNFEQQKKQFPASGFQAVQDVLPENFASIQAAGQTAVDAVTGNASDISEQFDKNKLNLQRREEALRQQQPFATGAGDVTGDVATLVTGRRPVANLKSRAATRARMKQEAKQRSSLFGLPEEVRKNTNDVLTGTILPSLGGGAKKISRGAGKAAEAGIEGAVLSVLNDGDPITSAAWSAGAQGIASPGLFLLEESVKTPWRALGTGALAFSLWQAYGPDAVNVLESSENAVRKYGAGLALGVLSGALGAGRVRGEWLEKFPQFADAMTSVPRGVAISKLNELTGAVEDGDVSAVQVMEKFASNPSFFSASEQRKLGEAMMSKKTGAFRDQVSRLMKNKKFREKVENL